MNNKLMPILSSTSSVSIIPAITPINATIPAIVRMMPTFLEYFSIELTEENQKMIYIPKGFAHGFQTLEDNTELLYLHSSVYKPSNEGALNIKDPLLNIKWSLDTINLSKRDQEHKFLDNGNKILKQKITLMIYLKV